MISTKFIRNWKTYVDKRATHLSIARRLDVSADGTCMFSLSTLQKREHLQELCGVYQAPSYSPRIYLKSTSDMLLR